MRVVPNKTAISVAALVTAFTGPAVAQSLNQTFNEGFELSPIQPTPAGDRFFLVPGGFSDPDAPHGVPPIRAKVLMHYALAPTLTRTDNQAPFDELDLVKNQLYAHVNVTGYLLPWLMVNADMPFAIYQTGDGNTVPKSAVGDLRLGARFGLAGKRSDAFAISPGIDMWVGTGSAENLTGDEDTRAEPYLSIGGQASVFVYSAKAGVMFRNHVYTGSLEVGTSMTFGAAAGVSLFDNSFQIGPEISGRSLLDSESGQVFAGRASPITTALGAKFQIGDFNLGAAFGIGITESPGTAPRALLSFGYNPIQQHGSQKPTKTEEPPKAEEPAEETAPAPEAFIPAPAVDSDGDNIPDADDACPNLLGDANEDPAENGCPYRAPEPEPVKPPPAPVVLAPLDPNADQDGDGIRDTEDSCPRTKGIVQPDNDSRNGCPASRPVTVEPAAKKTKAAVGAATAAAPATVHQAPPGPPTATWVGFRKLSESSALIYVNLTETVPVSSEVKGNTITFTMSGTRIKIKNNKNPLLAEHFGSVVKSAKMVPRGKDVKLIIVLKENVQPTSRVVRNAQGATLRVELARATAPAAKSAAQ